MFAVSDEALATALGASAGDAIEEELRRLRARIAELERERVLHALAKVGGNQTRAAELLGMPRRTLVSRLRKYGKTNRAKRAAANAAAGGAVAAAAAMP